MLVRPVAPPRRRERRDGGYRRPFILRSELGATILRMISTHSLPAFTPAIDRATPTSPPRDAVPPAQAIEAATPVAQRSLEAVPAQPARPLPRGSLLDLRV